MISILGQGFMLGLAYAMPIGAQNIFVINAASRGTMTNAMRTALIFAIMDISLGLACIVGVGQLVQGHVLIRATIGALGAGFLLFIGWGLLRKKADVVAPGSTSLAGSLWKAAFLLTWCNPHALMDGSLLLGGYQSALSSAEIYIFAVGLALASSTWFFSLSAVVNHYRETVTQRNLVVLNRLCGVALMIFGARLAYTLIGVWL